MALSEAELKAIALPKLRDQKIEQTTLTELNTAIVLDTTIRDEILAAVQQGRSEVVGTLISTAVFRQAATAAQTELDGMSLTTLSLSQIDFIFGPF